MVLDEGDSAFIITHDEVQVAVAVDVDERGRSALADVDNAEGVTSRLIIRQGCLKRAFLRLVLLGVDELALDEIQLAVPVPDDEVEVAVAIDVADRRPSFPFPVVPVERVASGAVTSPLHVVWRRGGPDVLEVVKMS